MAGEDRDLAQKRFIVCIDEVRQNFVFGAEFRGGYRTSVTLADGTTRTVELTPMIRDGKPVVELNDSGHRSYMGLNGTTTNGELMVQIRDLDAMPAKSHVHPPASPVLPRDTSLLGLPEFVPSGFVQGIEILNDDATPMAFVTLALTTGLGLSPADANRAMLEIHVRGGGLFATPSWAEAQRIAAQITAAAAKHGYPLVCRPVSTRSAG